MIQFTVHSVPLAQPRQRQRVVTANGRTFATNYLPRKHPVNAFKAAVQMAFRGAYHGPPLEGPVYLQMVFVLPRPRSLVWKKKSMPRLWHCHKPDIENLVKAVMDALKGLAYRDDCQVSVLWVSKSTAAGDEGPGVAVMILEDACYMGSSDPAGPGLFGENNRDPGAPQPWMRIKR
jgi:Holliday junction resolvase RusA-like endonuclease